MLADVLLQGDTEIQDQGVSSSSRATSKRKDSQPDGPRFELTDTQYAAPFMLTSIGGWVGAGSNTARHRATSIIQLQQPVQ
jgi:hypothetical protein